MILRKRFGATQVSIDDVGLPGIEDAVVEPADQAPSPEAQYAQLQERAMVRSAIGTLRPSIGRALELRTLEERSPQEIAESMGISVPAAKSRIFHARAALRKSLRTKVSRRSHATKALQLSAA
jgi:RNA polymerase sigma-70 factor (ECF subfamily)